MDKIFAKHIKTLQTGFVRVFNSVATISLSDTTWSVGRSLTHRPSLVNHHGVNSIKIVSLAYTISRVMRSPRGVYPSDGRLKSFWFVNSPRFSVFDGKKTTTDGHFFTSASWQMSIDWACAYRVISRQLESKDLLSTSRSRGT